MIFPLTSTDIAFEQAGGKGTNLARLARAGYPVPRGFIISTEAYRNFVEANHLDDTIRSSVGDLIADDAEKLELASGRIRAAFSRGTVPGYVAATVRTAYADLGQVPVAVRSSATAEDLPDLSFAGQQDTYLNVLGDVDLLDAMVKCWGSLWTGRAIGYRIRNGISHENGSLAVVVQEMVPSEVSGVLFTANPLTGLLSETVIDATFGLGEALVSGQVEPDHYVIDHRSGEIVSISLGAKEISIRARADVDVEVVEEAAGARQTLSEDEIRQLASLGQRIQLEFGAPQDIEWAFADGTLSVLQSRPITSLFPIPEISFDPLIAWFSFAAVQGVVDPITPLGQDVIRGMVAGAGKMFGRESDPEEIKLFALAGERFWLRISDAIRHPIGNRLYEGLLGYVEPGAAQIMTVVASDPRFGAGRGKIKPRTFIRILRFILPMVPRFIHTFLRPANRRAEFEAQIEAYLTASQITLTGDRFANLANILSYIQRRIFPVFSFALPKFIPVFGPSMAALRQLIQVSDDNRDLALAVTRSLPGNVTAQMDLALWETAREIQADPDTAILFLESDVEDLTQRYLEGDLPSSAMASIERFLDRYGMRGVGEIDIGQPRWREYPAPIFQTLFSYMSLEPESTIDSLSFHSGEDAQIAVDKLALEARKRPGGWIREKMVRASARRVRLLMGARESPKFLIVRLFGIAREALLEVGAEFVEAGTLHRADDLFFLHQPELEALSRNETLDWKTLIADRRETHRKECRRRRIPRVLISDGRAYYEGLGAGIARSDVIAGSPVSPGVVEGVVHVVLDPGTERLVPGEILVCPGTDPAWTPLLICADGLITEVGGMMTHGSVVAREFGIPAVVGVHNATERLRNGQKIRIDGSAGVIEVIDP